METSSMPRFRRSLAAGALALLSLAVTTSSTRAEAQMPHEEIFSFFETEVEYRVKDGSNSVEWEAEGWVGGDYDRLWLKLEGEQPLEGETEEAEFQVLYGRLITPFFDLLAGLRYDLYPSPTPDTGHAVLGLQGLAPYWFEVDTALFLSERGDLTARFEAEYELLLTQRLALEPRLEINLAAQSVETLDVGAGISDIELGARLRYEIVREFAPFVGVTWERKLFKTADFARDEGEEVDELAFVAGIRFWF